jgi:hypothetical protein
MEDIAPPQGGDVPPCAGDLPPEYQALVAGGYDEEALLQQVLEASKADEDKAYPGYSNAISLTGWWQSTWRQCHLNHHYRRTLLSWRRTRGRRCRRHPAFRAGDMTTRTGWSSTRRCSPSRRSLLTSSPTMRSSWRWHSCRRSN